MSPNPDFVMQTLGAIVQAYASILALGGAFFLFVIEGNKREKEVLEERIDNWISLHEKEGYLKEFKTGGIVHFRQNMFGQGGSIILKHLVEEMNKDIPDFDVRIENTYPYSELYKRLKRYEKVKARNAAWSFKKFSNLLALSSTVLIITLIVMGVISFYGLINRLNNLFISIVVFAIIGIFGLIFSMINIVKTEKEIEDM